MDTFPQRFTVNGTKERQQTFCIIPREGGNPVRCAVSGYWAPAVAGNDAAKIPIERNPLWKTLRDG
jgi:hypothetical protein